MKKGREMKKVKLFVSFRFSDGESLKNKLVDKLSDYSINKSESEDRSGNSDEVIWEYLKEKLKDTSITVSIITPDALNYSRNSSGIDDWLYDEQRFSLHDRDSNRTNGMIALYTDDTARHLYDTVKHKCGICNEEKDVKIMKERNCLLSRNVTVLKNNAQKVCNCTTLFDSHRDCYVSFIHFDDFLSNPKKYIDIAIEKRNRINDFDLVKLLK